MKWEEAGGRQQCRRPQQEKKITGSSRSVVMMRCVPSLHHPRDDRPPSGPPHRACNLPGDDGVDI